jgi:hypothetical protein
VKLLERLLYRSDAFEQMPSRRVDLDLSQGLEVKQRPEDIIHLDSLGHCVQSFGGDKRF